ncbi:hypothetical protein M5K25_005284 [Dendrobium thyrsiflorum]|uniref:Uncharacterized protein n=1 Tax=Dendrobium thyrsiflorum TaxID=117978 RepID=A0ABD0VI60_DENTH
MTLEVRNGVAEVATQAAGTERGRGDASETDVPKFGIGCGLDGRSQSVIALTVTIKKIQPSYSRSPISVALAAPHSLVASARMIGAEVPSSSIFPIGESQTNRNPSPLSSLPLARLKTPVSHFLSLDSSVRRPKRRNPLALRLSFVRETQEKAESLSPSRTPQAEPLLPSSFLLFARPKPESPMPQPPSQLLARGSRSSPPNRIVDSRISTGTT